MCHGNIVESWFGFSFIIIFLRIKKKIHFPVAMISKTITTNWNWKCNCFLCNVIIFVINKNSFVIINIRMGFSWNELCTSVTLKFHADCLILCVKKSSTPLFCLLCSWLNICRSYCREMSAPVQPSFVDWRQIERKKK